MASMGYKQIKPVGNRTGKYFRWFTVIVSKDIYVTKLSGILGY
jgi:hypothetical protein